MHLHCSMTKQGGLADDFFLYSVHIVIGVFISPTYSCCLVMYNTVAVVFTLTSNWKRQ